MGEQGEGLPQEKEKTTEEMLNNLITSQLQKTGEGAILDVAGYTPDGNNIFIHTVRTDPDRKIPPKRIVQIGSVSNPKELFFDWELGEQYGFEVIRANMATEYYFSGFTEEPGNGENRRIDHEIRVLHPYTS